MKDKKIKYDLSYFMTKGGRKKYHPPPPPNPNAELNNRTKKKINNAIKEEYAAPWASDTQLGPTSKRVGNNAL